MFFGSTNATDWVREIVDIPLPWELGIYIFFVAMATIYNGYLGDWSIYIEMLALSITFSKQIECIIDLRSYWKGSYIYKSLDVAMVTTKMSVHVLWMDVKG